MVEAFGDFWHSRMFTGKAPFAHEQELIDAYADIGFKCLVVWESELELDPEGGPRPTICVSGRTMTIRIKPTYDREPNTTWTYKDRRILHQLWERRLRGDLTADLAEEIGIQSPGLRQRWRELGYDPEALRREEEAREVSRRDKQVYLLRVGERLTYEECCLRLGLVPTHSNRTKLRNRLLKWCEENQVPYPGRKSADGRNAQVYQMRLDGMSYPAIADALGLGNTPQVRRTLCSSLQYFCKKTGLSFPKPQR